LQAAADGYKTDLEASAERVAELESEMASVKENAAEALSNMAALRQV